MPSSSLSSSYPDLRFTKAQLYFTDEEYKSIALDFWNNAPKGALDDRDRAFLQAALFVAIDKSEKAGLIFSFYRAFVSSVPSQSVLVLLRKLTSVGAKHAFGKYIDKDPKYSAAGRAGVQYSAFSTQWKLRVGVGDSSFLDNFFVNK